MLGTCRQGSTAGAWRSGSGLRDRFLGGQPQNHGKRGERDAANGFHAHNSSELGWSANRGRSLAEGATENGWKNSAREPARALLATTRRVLDRNSAQADRIDKLEIAVWAPMPSARVRTVIMVKPGLRRRRRKAWRRSCQNKAISVPWLYKTKGKRKLHVRKKGGRTPARRRTLPMPGSGPLPDKQTMPLTLTVQG